MSVRHYNVTLTTQGPVHIGDGSSYSGKDYFVDSGKITVLDSSKFVSALTSQQLTEYCSFLETDSREGLHDFLERHRELRVVARKAALYQVDMRLARSRRGSYQYFNVSTCLKDAYGFPYIPGSSVKGMLRTVVLANVIAADQAEFKAIYDKSAKTLARDKSKLACKSLDRKAFWLERPDDKNQEVVNDVMKYISVSDSKPLSVNDLVFVKKYDKFSRLDDGSHKMDMGRISREEEYYGGNALNIYRECIKPGTQIELRIDVDERIDAYMSRKLDALGLLEMLRSFNDSYRKYFLDQFDTTSFEGASSSSLIDDGQCNYVYTEGWLSGMRCRKHVVGGTGYCADHAASASASALASEAECYLGGGVDFDSKTVLNCLFSEKMDRLNEVSHVLYSQFPTKIDRRKHPELWREVEAAGFYPLSMRAHKRGRLDKAKDDHRHWRDVELGVSPHTMKLGIVGGKKYPMGKCSIRIEDAS